MTARNGIAVSAKEIAAWRDDDARLEREITERVQKRSEIKRKLDAVEVLSMPTDGKEEKEPPTAEPLAQETEDGGGSPAFDLLENLRKTGHSLKVQEARQRLVDLGHAEKANQKNYIYGLLFRLVKGGKLIKRGSKYKAAPTSSPQGEAGALGAPARH
jgi:hypothetical protein